MIRFALALVLLAACSKKSDDPKATEAVEQAMGSVQAEKELDDLNAQVSSAIATVAHASSQADIDAGKAKLAELQKQQAELKKKLDELRKATRE